MIDLSPQPDREEHGSKQLRAARQVLARSRFAAVIRLCGESGGYSWAFLIAGCIRVDRYSRAGRNKSGGLGAQINPAATVTMEAAV